MPMKPMRSCRAPGCKNYCYGPYCDEHRELSERRGSSAERGYGAKWRTARAVFLRHHPLCAECQRNGRLTPANVVDHIVPHRGNVRLFWDQTNWQPLCERCHDEKTGKGL